MSDRVSLGAAEALATALNSPKPTMERLAPLMSSKQGDWQTPPKFFAMLSEVALRAGRVLTDVAPPEYQPEVWDALATPWDSLLRFQRPVLGRTPTPPLFYFNPPYGRGIGRWFERARASSQPSIALHPARTDTRWFPWYADRICFVRGRVKFIDPRTGKPSNPAPFPVAFSLLIPPGPMPELGMRDRFIEAFEQVFGEIGEIR